MRGRLALIVVALLALARSAAAQQPYAPPNMTFGPAPSAAAASDPVAVATLAAVAPATPAPYAPPGMIFGPPLPAPPAAVAAVPAPSPWEWAFGAGGGRWTWRASWSGERALAIVLELSRVRRIGPSLVAGGMVSLPLGAGAVAGWRLGLSPALRVDLLADAGLMALRAGLNETEWAPAAGARAGLGWVSARRHRSLTLAAAARRAWGRTETVCDLPGQGCFRDRRGYTFLGAILTYGSVGAVPGSAADRAEGGRSIVP